MIRIVCTMLVGPGTAEISREAVKSARVITYTPEAGYVDIHLYPWGATDDDLTAPWEEGAVEFHEDCRSGEPRNFSEARNFALAAALEEGYDWAITLDTDERLHPHPEFLERFAALVEERPDVGVWLAEDLGAGYSKPRILRTSLADNSVSPATGPWKGPTHEVCHGKQGLLPPDLLHFSELPKTPEQAERKLLRDVELLANHDGDPRWWFYMGESWFGLASLWKGQDRKEAAGCAVVAYGKCADLRKLPEWSSFREEGAWAGIKTARVISEVLSEWAPPETVFAWCCEELLSAWVLCPWMPEIPWLLGYIAWGNGHVEQALAWSLMAIAVGSVEGGQHHAPKRVGFREWSAWYEGPYEIASACYSAMGKSGDAHEYRQRAVVAARMRASRQQRDMWDVQTEQKGAPDRATKPDS